MKALKRRLWLGDGHRMKEQRDVHRMKQLPDHHFTEYVTDYSQNIEVSKQTQFPRKAWETIMKDKKFQVSWVEPLPDPTPISTDKVRFVCLSDTHSRIEESSFAVPDGDVLLHAGDFTNGGSPKEVTRFNTFLGKLPHKYKIVIAGNHDRCLDVDDSKKSVRFRNQVLKKKVTGEQADGPDNKVAQTLLTNCIYLQDSTVELHGIKIYGSPWQPYHYKMAFNLWRGQDLLDKWNKIPEDTDILMTHGPPLGFGDVLSGNLRVGCVDLLNTVQRRVRPKYHIYGHIHEGYGVQTDGYTVFINAATCTHWHKAGNPPIVFDYPLPDGHTKDSLPILHHTSETDSTNKNLQQELYETSV